MRGWAFALACLAAMWSGAAAARCSVPAGWDAVVGAQAHYVVFGEIHGTAESPRLFGETACALAARGERLLVAVELSDDAGLQRAWSVRPARFAAALHAAMPEWTTRNDGVTSQAMFALLVRLHALKAAGRVIDIVAFNGTEDLERLRFATLPGQGPHEAGQAENIRVADALRPHHRVLVLVGNYHARRKPIAPGGIRYEPMAMRLGDPANVVSLYLADSGGQAWNCQMQSSPPPGGRVTSDMIECAAHDMRGDVGRSEPPRIVDAHRGPGPANPEGAYDATFFIGPVTASPPVGGRP